MRKVLVTLLLTLGLNGFAGDEVISLQGVWTFQRDDTIHLPGTTEEAGKGLLNGKRELSHLTRVRPYLGEACYEREVDIPRSWAGQHITFLMERTKTTTVWVDSICLGRQNSLTTAHVYDVSSVMTPGRHRLTVVVDNKNLPPVGDPHQLSDQTQTNWNGIVGRIELRKTDHLWFSDLRVVPDVKNNKAQLMVKFSTDKGMAANGKIEVSGEGIPTQRFVCRGDTGRWQAFDVKIPDAKLWDEFQPNLYKMQVAYTSRKAVCRRTVTFGMREFTTRSTQFNCNGKTVFLRGKHDACVFPLTGHAPMDVEDWLRVMRIAKSYGINHYRFHTWCPPEAAFEAADILGIYMQPELPVWGSIGAKAKVNKNDVEQKTDNDPVKQRTAYLREEGLRMLRAFGNHPSFVMMALGNEMSGSMDVMADLINTYRQYDDTKLYAQGSNNFLNKPRLPEGDDYWTTTFTRGHYEAGHYYEDTDGYEVRGSYPVHTKGHVNNEDCGTMRDYSQAIEGVRVPVIGHEIGQYQVFPNFKETKKYKGVVEARNFEVFRERLEKAGMQEQADEFFRNSGALAVECYREDIETALRTPGFGGFQLLDLQDFPGQGTALVGILDAFMDSKGLITPEEWRQFCSEVVPLVRMEKRIWKDGETFRAEAQVANYGASDLSTAPVSWQLVSTDGNLLSSGVLRPDSIPQGKVSKLGSICIPLSGIPSNQKAMLTLHVGNYKNQYPLWVFVDADQPTSAKQIHITHTLDAETIKTLEHGGKVLLLADTTTLRKHIPGAFVTDFWCYPMFKKYHPAGTMGLLCDTTSAVFREFPTESHSDWQWWYMAKHSPVMMLNSMPAGLHPIVQVIDNFERNNRLALLFETRVGKGRLMVSSIDLDAPRTEVQALRKSVLNYMISDEFRPETDVRISDIKELFRGKRHVYVLTDISSIHTPCRNNRLRN